MSKRSSEEIAAERRRALDERLAGARASIERSEEAARERRAPRAGDIFITPGSDAPEWLVVETGPKHGEWSVVALDESGATLTIEDEIAGRISLDPAARFVTTDEELRGKRRTGAVTNESLDAVRRAAPAPAAPPRTARRWLPIAAAAGLVVAGVAAALWQPAHRRDNPGLYALRASAAGEVGAELRIGDRICRARGVLEAGACPVKEGTKLTVEYRLDDNMSHRHAVVLLVRDAERTVAYAPTAPLRPTATGDEERCARGLCPMTTVAAEPGELWVVFLRAPPPAGDAPPSNPWSWPGAMPYRFELTSR